MTRFKPAVAVAITSLAALLWAAPAVAQDYPAKPVRIVVPWPAGGLVDVAARQVATRLQAALGQPVVVDNRVGAGGVIGADLVAKAPADGYTVLLTTSGLTINAALRTRMPFDAVKDLEPVAVVAYAPSVLVVQAGSNLRTVQELVAFAKSRPGSLSYASAGVGSPAHLSAELFKSQLGLFAVHIPYTGAPAAMNDQIAGRVDFHFANTAVALPQIKAGRVRALAVTSAKRLPGLPEVPTLAESAAPNFEADQWVGMLVPRGTPPAVVQRLAGEVNKALAAEDLRAALSVAGMNTAAPGTPAEFGSYFRSDLAKWSGVVKAANIQPE
jgi:tripartite-type tricarboxylate transporter receptor subunit TctC